MSIHFMCLSRAMREYNPREAVVQRQFLRFQVTVEPDGGPVRLDLTGPAGTREFLSALLDE